MNNGVLYLNLACLFTMSSHLSTFLFHLIKISIRFQLLLPNSYVYLATDV